MASIQVIVSTGRLLPLIVLGLSLVISKYKSCVTGNFARKKGAKNDTYLGTKVHVANSKISDAELNSIENKIMTQNGGHNNPKTYNKRASLGFG